MTDPSESWFIPAVERQARPRANTPWPAEKVAAFIAAHRPNAPGDAMALSAEHKRMADALRLIAGDRCENYTDGRCSDEGSGRTRISSTGTADQWCDACRAADALAGGDHEDSRDVQIRTLREANEEMDATASKWRAAYERAVKRGNLWRDEYAAESNKACQLEIEVGRRGCCVTAPEPPAVQPGPPMVAPFREVIHNIQQFGEHWSWRCGVQWTRASEGWTSGACRYDHVVDSWDELVEQATAHLAKWHGIAPAAAVPDTGQARAICPVHRIPGAGDAVVAIPVPDCPTCQVGDAR